MAVTRSNVNKSGRSGNVTKPAAFSATSKKHGSTKPPTIADRELLALAIDGTSNLGGKKPAPPKAGKAYKSGGAWWSDLQPSSKPAIPCKAAQKRRRADDTPASDDAQFLGEARRQLKKLRTHDAERMQPYLGHLHEPAAFQSAVQAGSIPDAYLCTAAEARCLLSSNAHIDAPVFVAGGSNTAGILDVDDHRRPIEQVLDWFVDPDEKHDIYEADSTKEITTGEIRERFCHHNGPVDGHPYNFPDMATPFDASITPHFVQTPSTNLLRDVLRYLLDVGPNNICQDNCKDRKLTKSKIGSSSRCCKKHFLTTSEFAELQLGWRHWQGTVMLAEAGALTMPHFDKWGFGTHLQCLEGEIGFAWLSHPTDKQLEAVLQTPDETEGRWLYKVLRPGDAMYMSPGTPHLVFRLPQGKQTLGLAGHVVRRCDLGRWVTLLAMEAEHGDRHDEGFGDVVRGMIAGIEHVVDKVASREEIIEQYGGKQEVAAVKTALKELKKRV